MTDNQQYRWLYGEIYLCTGTGTDWQACPSGTYSSTDGLYDVAQCLPCDAGKYCMGEHLTATTGDCAAGEFVICV